MQWISAFAKMHCPRLSFFSSSFIFIDIGPFCILFVLVYNFISRIVWFYLQNATEIHFIFSLLMSCLCFFMRKRIFKRLQHYSIATVCDSFTFFSIFVHVCAGLCLCALSLCMWKFISLHFVIFAFVCNLFHNCFFTEQPIHYFRFATKLQWIRFRFSFRLVCILNVAATRIQLKSQWKCMASPNQQEMMHIFSAKQNMHR